MAINTSAPGDKKVVGLPAEKKAVGLPVIILAIVLGLALIGFIGYRAFNPPQPRTAAMQKFDDYLSQKAKECNRDFSKLSAEDQAKINSQTMGNGAQAIRNAK